MSIYDIHTSGMNLFQSLITKDSIQKTAIISFPADCRNYRYKGKRFVVECTTSSIDMDRKKSNDSSYSGEAVKITLLISDLKTTRDTKDTVECAIRGFKSNNAKIRYNSVDYVIIEESLGEFRNSITLFCDITV